MPKCTDEPVGFGRVGRRVIEAAFDGGDIVSDGGVLLLRRVDERMGLTRSVARVFGDRRRAASVEHSVRDMLAHNPRPDLGTLALSLWRSAAASAGMLDAEACTKGAMLEPPKPKLMDVGVAELDLAGSIGHRRC